MAEYLFFRIKYSMTVRSALQHCTGVFENAILI